MKSKLLTIVLALILAVSTMGLTACDGETTGPNGLTPTKGIEYTLSADEEYYVCTGMGSATSNDIVIASLYEGLPVKEIGDDAFRGCMGLESVIVGDNVTSIGDHAFGFCEDLEVITMPDTVTTIGENAFRCCYCLTQIDLPSELTEIKNYTFNSSAIESIEIPAGVTKIGTGAFFNCTYLEEATIPDTVLSIGSFAFSICSSLKAIDIPDSVTYLGIWAFADCANLESVIIGDGVTEIGDRAFIGCKKVTSMQMGNGLNSIGFSAFYRLEGVESLTLPEGLTDIGIRAFMYCKIKYLVMPKSITHIANTATIQCDYLEKVYYMGTEADMSKIVVNDTHGELTKLATWYLYSEQQPTTNGNYWHYVNGEIVEWGQTA